MDGAGAHVLAAGFESRAEAAGAMRELRVTGVADSDLAIHTLGGDEGRGGRRWVVAGRFELPMLPDVEAVLLRHGGTVLADVPEAWTGRAPGTAARQDGHPTEDLRTGA